MARCMLLDRLFFPRSVNKKLEKMYKIDLVKISGGQRLKREVPDCYGEYTRGEPKCLECWAGDGCIQLTVLKKVRKPERNKRKNTKSAGASEISRKF